MVPFHLFTILIFLGWSDAQNMDIQPFLSLLRPENMQSMAQLATELSSMASKNMRDNEKDVQRTVAAPKPPTPEQRPSQMIGGAIQNLAFQGRNAFLDALDKLESGTPLTPPTLPPPPPASTFPTLPPMTFPTPTPQPPMTLPPMFGTSPPPPRDNSFDTGRDVLGVREFKKKSVLQEKMKEIRYAEPSEPSESHDAPETLPVRAAGVETLEASPEIPKAVAAIASRGSVSLPAQGSEGSQISQSVPLSRPPAPTNSFDGSPFMQIARRFLQVGTGTANANGKNEPLPQIGIRDFVPNTDSNFGLPRGKGCLPFISEFMQIAYGNCQNVADEKTFDAWGDELRRAIMTGEIDLLKASQETCRRGAERQQCDALREAVANCDVMASIEIGSQLQRAMKRCEEVSGMMDQSPAAVLGQLNSLISGEVAQGFLNNFLKNGR